MPFDQMLNKPGAVRSKQGMLGKGLGPSQPMQKPAPQQGPALGQANWGPAVQNAGAGVMNAFGRQPGGMSGGLYAPPQAQPQTPEPTAPASPVDDQNMQAMQNLKQQQMAQMSQGIGSGMSQMFGQSLGGGQGMARPLPFQRNQQMMNQETPTESIDQFRKNKFQQMRAGGIGPRFGMRQPQIQLEPEPQQY